MKKHYTYDCDIAGETDSDSYTSIVDVEGIEDEPLELQEAWLAAYCEAVKMFVRCHCEQPKTVKIELVNRWFEGEESEELSVCSFADIRANLERTMNPIT